MIYKNHFEGKVIIITGAAGALGKAVSEAFVREGGIIAQLDMMEIDNEYYSAHCDLTNSDSCTNEVEKVIETYGKIDVVANIAGGFTMGETVYETSEKTWEFMLNLNTLTVLNMAKAAIPKMIERKSGRFINIAAMAGLGGSNLMGAYSASKSAVIRLTESLAEEVRAKGIAVNCVLPSIIDTPRNRIDMPNEDFSKWVSPEDLANIIVFLGSAFAGPINGAAIPIKGLS